MMSRVQRAAIVALSLVSDFLHEEDMRAFREERQELMPPWTCAAHCCSMLLGSWMADVERGSSIPTVRFLPGSPIENLGFLCGQSTSYNPCQGHMIVCVLEVAELCLVLTYHDGADSNTFGLYYPSQISDVLA
jgi:hypothetical protein